MSYTGRHYRQITEDDKPTDEIAVVIPLERFQFAEEERDGQGVIIRSTWFGFEVGGWTGNRRQRMENERRNPYVRSD